MTGVDIWTTLVDWFQGLFSDFSLIYSRVFVSFGDLSEFIFGTRSGLLWFLSFGALLTYLSIAIVKWAID